MTMQDAIQKMWEDFRLRGLSESTFRNYTRNVKQFLEFCNRPIDKLNETDVRDVDIRKRVEKSTRPLYSFITINARSATRILADVSSEKS